MKNLTDCFNLHISWPIIPGLEGTSMGTRLKEPDSHIIAVLHNNNKHKRIL